MKTAKVLTALLIVALALCLPASTFAQQSVTVQVDAGFDGYYSRSLNPTPVRIELKNTGESFKARVQSHVTTPSGTIRFYQDVELPQNSTKIVTLYPVITQYVPNIKVEVLDEQGKVVAKAQADLTSVQPTNDLFGIMGSNLTPYNSLISPGSRSGSFVASLSPDNFTDRADALGAFSMIVIDGTSPDSLTDPQRAALRSWVATGGNLIIAGGKGSDRNAAGLSDLMPVTLTGTRNGADTSSVASLAGVSSAPSGGVIATATPKQRASVLAGSAQQPLVVKQTLGNGTVTWLAWSPSADPWSGWNGSATLLRSLATGSPGQSIRNSLDGYEIDQFLQRVAGIQLPPTALIAVFLLIYALILGPGVYFFLRRSDQRERAWMVVPALTIIFSIIAYGGGFLIRGTGVVMRSLEVVDVYPAARTEMVTSYSGLFSPTRRDYDIALQDGYVLLGDPIQQGDVFSGGGPGPQNGTSYTVESGNGQVLRDLRVDVYSFRTFEAQQVRSVDSPAVETDFAENGATLSGSVTNKTAGVLEDVYVLKNERMARLGTLQPGQKHSFAGLSSSINSFFPNSSQQMTPHQRVLASIFSSNAVESDDPVLIAWQKTSEYPAKVLNADADGTTERLLIIHPEADKGAGATSVSLKPTTFRAGDRSSINEQYVLTYKLPSGYQPRTMGFRVVSQNPYAGYYSPFGGGYSGSAPAQPIPSGKGSASYPSGGPVVALRKVEFRQPSSGNWVRVKGVASGASVSNVKNPGEYLDDTGMVTVRVTLSEDVDAEPGWFVLSAEGSNK